MSPSKRSGSRQVTDMQGRTALPLDDHQTVWHSTSSDGAWTAQVQRGGRSGGQLLVWHESDRTHPMFTKPVVLEYGAMFGVSSMEIQNWEETMREAIERAGR